MLTKNKITAVSNGSGVCADIVGFDFNDYDAQDVAEVRKIWLQYGVVRFRDIDITDEQHIKFSHHFGKLLFTRNSCKRALIQRKRNFGYC